MVPTSVASGVLEKINEITSQSSSIKLPTPEVFTIPTPKDPLDKSNDLENTDSFNYKIQSPAYLSNFLKTENSCDMVEVVGQVFGVNGQALDGMVVIVKNNNTEPAS